MIETNGQIVVEVADVESEFEQILQVVEQRHQHVRICRGGQPIAEISPVQAQATLPPLNPDLRVKFSPDYDPTAGLDLNDWPEELR